MMHKFDVDLATKYGVYKALLIDHIIYHQNQNEGKKEYTFKKKSWASLKRETMIKMYPYMSPSSMYEWLNELEKEGAIESIQPYKSKMDHSRYYRFKGNVPMSEPQTSMSRNQKNPSESRTSMSEPQTSMSEPRTPQKEVFKSNQPMSEPQTSMSEPQTSMSEPRTPSIVTNVNNYFVKLSGGKAAEMIGKILKGITPPEFVLPLFDDKEFPQAYVDYWCVIRNKFSHWPDPVTVVEDYRKLIELTPDGSNASAIVRQTIHTKNKSFFALRKKLENKPNNQRQRPTWK